MKKRKQVTAQILLNELLEIAKDYDLSNIRLSYRYDYDSDVEPITEISEGLYDSKTNSILEELIFVTDTSDK